MKKLFLFWPVLILFSGPAWADQADLAGVYVKCPPKNEAGCPEISEKFRRLFPNSHSAPFMIIRKDGKGYLAPDERRTINFTWELQVPDLIVLKMSEQGKKKVEYRISGPRLVNEKNRETYLMSLSDAEWNPEPQPFKIKAKNNPGEYK